VFLCEHPKSNSKWFISVSCQPYFRGPEVRGHQTYEGTNLLPYPFSLLAITVSNVPLHTVQLNGSQAIRLFNFFQQRSRHGVKMTRNKLFCTAPVFRWVHCPPARQPSSGHTPFVGAETSPKTSYTLNNFGTGCTLNTSRVIILLFLLYFTLVVSFGHKKPITDYTKQITRHKKTKLKSREP